MKTLVVVCKFKRERYSKWEKGIAFGSLSSDIDSILDKSLRLLEEEPWDYELLFEEGTLKLEL